MSPVTMDYLYQDVGGVTVLGWRGNATILLGIAASALLIPPCISSIPDIADHLTKNSWNFMQSTCGKGALVLATSHAVVLGIEIWSPIDEWRAGIPPVSLAAVVLPVTAILSLAIVALGNGVKKVLRIKSLPHCHAESDCKGVQLALY